METNSVEIGGGFDTYPNPASDKMNIKSGKDIKEIVIFNLTEQTVLYTEKKNENPETNVSAFAAGTYVVKVTDKQENSSTNKFIKK